MLFSHLSNFYCRMLLCGAVTQILAYVVLKKRKQLKLEYIFFIQAIIVGYIYSTIFPAFTISDEMTHFMSGYHIANEMSGMRDVRLNDVAQGSAYYDMYIRDIDEELFSFSTQFDIEKLTETQRMRHKIFAISDGYVIRENVKTTDYFPFPEYTIMGVAIFISRLFGFSPYMMVWFTRMLNLVVYALFGACTIRIVPFGKLMMYTVLAMPMGLISACSAAYHGTLYAVTIFFVAYILYLQTVEKISQIHMTFLIVLIVSITPLKGSFLFYSFLLLLLPYDLFANKRQYYLFMILSITAGISIWFLYNAYIIDLGKLLSNATGPRIIKYDNAGEGIYLMDLFVHPLRYIHILLRTIILRGFYLDRSMSAMQADFGSLYFNICFGIFIINSIFNSEGVYFKNKRKDKLIILFVYAASYILMSFVVLFQWGARTWEWIELKGVYTFQFLPLVGFLLKGSTVPAMDYEKQKCLTYFVLGIMHFVGIMNLLLAANVI